MFCNKCGKQLTDGSVYCNYCGSKLGEGTDDKIKNFADKLGNVGKTLTIFITLPILIIFLIYLAYSCSR